MRWAWIVLLGAAMLLPDGEVSEEERREVAMDVAQELIAGSADRAA